MMTKRTQALALILIAAIAVVAVWLFVLQIRNAIQPTQPQTSEAPPQIIATIAYSCDVGRKITATYYGGEDIPAATPGQPPVPGGSVQLALSDGRTMTLAQTLSADGARYANADESFAFWSKGNGALVLENNQEKSYAGCIAVASEPSGQNLSGAYSNSSQGFSIRYPAEYAIEERHIYQALGPGKDIFGIKFTVPSSTADGTNLNLDSYISVEEIPGVQSCAAELFLGLGITSRPVAEGGTDYSFASSTDAAAGNRYEESVYALPGTNPCVGIRYFIHYGVLENYPAGTVKQFDREALLNQFDAMRRTLVIAQ